MRIVGAGGMAALLLLAGAASAQTSGLREFCGDRPGLSTEPCTVDPGHLQAEFQPIDQLRERTDDTHADTTEYGQLLLRYGVGPATELRLAWNGISHQRERDPDDGSLSRVTRAGDITLGLKQNLRMPDGNGFSIALVPQLLLPVGREPIGAGTWAATLLIPLSYELTPALKLTMNPRVDAAANMSGHGRHFAYSNILGAEIEFVEDWVLDLEVQAIRDRDPQGHQTLAFAAASLAYTIGDRTQLDAGTTLGLNRASPDLELYWGISRKF